MHTTGGYLTQVAFTHKHVFDLHPDTDVYWCAADVGWVTGHSYIVYGPLANRDDERACTRARPTSPTRTGSGRSSRSTSVTILYTAPTAIRTFMKWGTEFPERHDLSSLRLLGIVGEPINPEAWVWYWQHIGGGRCPVVDTWWQTETGAIMISPLPGATDAEARQRDVPAARHRRRRRRRRGRSRSAIPGGGYLVLDPAVAVDAARDLGRPRALPRDVLEPVRRPVLRRRRRQARRRGLLLAARPRRRRDARVGPQHLDRRGRARARRPPGGVPRPRSSAAPTRRPARRSPRS